MSVKRRLGAAIRALRNPGLVESSLAQRALGEQWKTGLTRPERAYTVARKALETAGITSGRMLEIKSDKKGHGEAFASFDYFSISLDNIFEERGAAPVKLADFSMVPNDSFDFIFTNRALEHMAKPWETARELARMLKPGGVTVHASLFSWYYHPNPIDYWRFSPAGLESLFPGIKTLHADFDQVERRRDIRGKGGNSAEIDSLGGWRENVGVIYAGQKPLTPMPPKVVSNGNVKLTAKRR